MPSLSARLMGLDSLGVASYLLTLYFSCAVLTDAPTGRIAIYYGAADTVTCLAFARDWTERKSIIWGKHVTGHAREYDWKDGTGFAQMYGYDGQPMNTSANFGTPFYPLEYILRDAVGPDGQYHGGVGRTISTIRRAARR